MNRQSPLRLLALMACTALGMAMHPAGWCAAAPAPGLPVAVVTDLAGHVQLRRPAGHRALSVLDVLQPGDQLQLDVAATAELAFTAETGTVLRLIGPGRFRVRTGDVLPRDAGALVERRRFSRGVHPEESSSDGSTRDLRFGLG